MQTTFFGLVVKYFGRMEVHAHGLNQDQLARYICFDTLEGTTPITWRVVAIHWPQRVFL